MSYNEELLKEFIRRSIDNRVDERIRSDAGKAAGDVHIGAPKHTAFGDRWGWHGTVERCPERECGILHTLGMTKSTWEWPGKMKNFFTAWWDLATSTGQKFLEILESTVNPSPGSQKNWAFPRVQKFVDKATGKGPKGRASWGSSYATAKPRSGGDITGGSLFTGGEAGIKESLNKLDPLLVRSLLSEAAGDTEFISALTGDLGDIAAFVNNVKTGLDVIDTVSTWKEKVDTNGSVTDLSVSKEDLKADDLDEGRLMQELIDDVLLPYIREMLDEMPAVLSKMGVPDDMMPEVEQMISATSQKI